MAAIHKLLKNSPSKSEALKLCQSIVHQPPLIDDLIQMYLEGSTRLTQRAAGVICLCAEKAPVLVIPYLPAMLAKLKEPDIHDAAKRNTLRILQFIDIPEQLEDEVMDLCFGYLESRAEAVAIKVFSMSVLYRLSEKYPELRNELRILIEDQMPYQKPAFISRGTKILAKLGKG